MTFASQTSDGGPNFDMFTFGIDGVVLYDGTQKLPVIPEASVVVIPYKSGVAFNPQTGVLFTPKAGFAEVYFYDMSGAVRLGVSRNVQAGSNVFSIDRDVLPKGMYIVNVKMDGKTVASSKFRSEAR